MTGRERVLATLRRRETDRIPWVPFVGCHGGALIGADAKAYLQSADLMVRGAAAAVERYQPDGLPVVFDLQIEAEVLGCELAWSTENPPAVTSHPLAGGEKALGELSVPGPDAGRIAVALDAARRMRKAHEDIALYGLITGPFTLALHLLGTDIFMKMFDEPETVASLMEFCRDVSVAMAGYYLDAGCDVVAVVDPMTSQIGPDQFRQYVTPYVVPLFHEVRRRGALGSFFVCGHAQQNLEAMCECRPDNISVDENIPLSFVREVCEKAHVSFGGNMQLTTVLLLGSPDDARRNAVECMEIGGETGFVLAPGCDLPYATPPENLQAVTQVVLDPYQREIAKTVSTAQTREQLDLKDYGLADKVIVDIITLDSEACAPCQYMVEAVRKVAPEFEGIVEWREHKIKYRESLVWMTSLMVHNVPTICIDGEIRFVSRIPARDELVAAIQDRIFEKIRVKIGRRRASLLILGDGGEGCRKLQENAEKAITE
ncbi:MAG TPA: uroporphyrinogen decarboxylase, partial [Phycisphaerales bacterium]|nr:uroporphyrinogen decarboxylase [Phycisphaerales bacterium]